MAKQSGLGMNLYVDGYDLSGDAMTIRTIRGGNSPLEFTDITQSAYERQGGLRDGEINTTTYFNPASSRAHPVYSALPMTDRQISVTMGTVIGSAAASHIAKQINYDGTRGDDGSYVLTVDSLSNTYGLEWGELLTAGIRTDTTATNGTAYDFTASTSFGWRAFLHITAFTGTNITITLQDSADNVSFAGFTGSAFAVATSIGPQRIAGADGSTVRRYVRAISSGTFSSCSFSVIFMKPQSADVVF